MTSHITGIYNAESSHSNVIICCATTSNMWLPLALLIFVGLVSADYEHGWKTGEEYTYVVRSRTLTGLEQFSKQYTGIIMKALLTVQAKNSNMLTAKVWKGQYARIHYELVDDWETDISDDMLDLRKLPLSEKPFEIKLKHGVIRDLIVEKDTPSWEVNILKSIVSQLQVDTQGENIIKNENIQTPSDDDVQSSFRAMEDTVSGKCEVLYDIMPLEEHIIHINPELVPKPELRGEGQHIDIIKTKNFDNCVQRVSYHFGITGETNWEPGTNRNGKFLTNTANSRIIISGNLKHFTIQSSVTTSKMMLSPRFSDNQVGTVASRMNLTLGETKKISTPLSLPKNPQSTGNLVYNYDNPFSDDPVYRHSQTIKDGTSGQDLISDSVSSLSSSEEATKTKANLRDTDSLSSDSSSSISSSEEHRFWQPKPTLEHAPQNPLLPNFIGYKGKFIGKSGNIDLNKAVKELVGEIAQEIEDPSTIPTQKTLEKFTILCNLIRAMNREEIASIEGYMHISPYELKSCEDCPPLKQNAWTVFRDAVTQAGTGPALLTIKYWFEREWLTCDDATEILISLPRTVRTPTATYVKTLFNLAISPQVMSMPSVHTTAIISFTELVYQSQVNGKTLHNLYPVHTFGRMISKHDQTLLQEYIPYLQNQLKQAFKDGDSQKIQTYIVALGNLGHPKMLSIFEPYLEGKERVTVFQKTLMVSAFSKLTTTHPKLARSVLYKIYLNTMESHEVRCMAVYLLMKTNPPVSLMQRIAMFTQFDTNKQVNSAVKSTIENLAESAMGELAEKAQAVKNLLTDKDYDLQYSQSIMDVENNVGNEITEIVLNYIGSDDSLIPRAVYLAILSSYGDFKLPPTELVAMISTIRPLLDSLTLMNEQTPVERMATEDIAEQLNIIAEDAIQLEGNILINSKFLLRFLPFDKNSVTDTINKLKSHLPELAKGRNINTSRFMSYDMTLSFPTETGLPFVYTLRAPVVSKISGKINLQTNKDISGQDMTSELRILLSKKIQGRIGFVTPFDHQHFIAGVDVNTQMYTPFKVGLTIDTIKNTGKLKLWPLKNEKNALIGHYSVVPYTSNHDILSLRPLSSEKSTRMVITRDIRSMTIPEDKSWVPVKLVLEADNLDEEILEASIDNADSILQWSKEDDTYRKIDLYMDIDYDQNEPFVLNVSYDWMDVTPGTEKLTDWKLSVVAVEPTNKEPDSKARKEQYLKEAAKGIKSAHSNVVDIELEIPGSLANKELLTIAWANSNVDAKKRILLYWNINIPSTFEYEVCIGTKIDVTPNSFLFLDQVLRSQPRLNLGVEVRHGSSCSENKLFGIKGTGTQSDEIKKAIDKSPEVKECQKQMNQGNKFLRICQEAAKLAATIDHLHFTVDIPHEDLTSIDKGIDMIEILVTDIRTNTANSTNADNGTIEFDIKASKDRKNLNAVIRTHTKDMHFEVNNYDPVTNEFMMILEDEMDIRNLAYNSKQPSCILDKTMAETFDGMDYPLRLGNCWHVAMTTYPKNNPKKPDEKLRIPEETSVTILTRELDGGKKEVKVMLGQNEIKLLPPKDWPEVWLNGEKIKVTESVSYQKKTENEVDFEIIVFEDSSVAIVSEKYEVNLVYDGKRLMIRASEEYRNSVRGLCGNFDDNWRNDFIAPNNCMLTNSKYFVASYALIKDQCEGQALETAKMIKKSDCIPIITTRASDVINDIESGKSRNNNKNWGYHQDKYTGDNKKCSTFRTKVIEKDNMICFSMKPVISCAPSCSPTETKQKNYQFHCMKKNPSSLSLKNRIERGANPDLTQKPVTMSQLIEVPLHCAA